MAVALPKYAVAADDVATQLYIQLSSVLADNYKIYQYLSRDDLPTGNLFYLQQGKCSLFVFICTDDSQELSHLNVREILSYKSESLHKLLHFQQSLVPQKLQVHTNLLAPFMVILPDSFDVKSPLHLTSRGIHIFGRDALMPESFSVLANKYMGISMSSYALAYMRYRFNPELAILKCHSLHRFDEQDSLKLEHFFLSDEQEMALKQDLVLKTKEASLHPYNLRLIHGAAGSGKSLLLLHRAKLLRELYPEKKILVLTHNKAINHCLKLRYKRLFNDEENECHPFMAWCQRQWKCAHRFVYEDEVKDVVVMMLQRHLKGTVFTRHLFLREINFIKDRLIFTESDYLKISRSGQAYSLDVALRIRLWQAVLDFDAELKARHVLLWADLPRLLWNDLEEGKISLEQYDHVLVDEAQYFAPIWFELIKKAIKPQVGQLYMVADPDQGFLNRSLSWKETGIDLRNRTTRLQRNYRSNPLILKVADEYRLNRIPDEADHMLGARSCSDFSSEDCIAPMLLHFNHQDDEKNRLLSEVHKLLQQGTEPKDILILDAARFSIHSLLQTIKNSLNQPACILTDSHWNKKALRLCELETATGLESPIVFITGLHALFDKEKRAGIGDRERQVLMVENTRKLYMGMTRASNKLILLLTSDIIPKSLHIKEMDTPTTSSTELATVRYLHV
jgi:superfamily I DNA/RNA helicase